MSAVLRACASTARISRRVEGRSPVSRRIMVASRRQSASGIASSRGSQAKVVAGIDGHNAQAREG